MLLEIDAGNTRIKWRVSALPEQDAVVDRGVVNAVAVDSSIELLLQQLGDIALQEILVSSVRTADFREKLDHVLFERFAVRPLFVTARASFGVIRNAYDKSERLGVDRWLALVAAYTDAQRACCVMDCGTTVTLDVVAADGQHLGGYIVPGLQLLRETLGRRSTALQVTAVPAELAPGRDTEAAIANGVLAMVLAFIQQQYQQLAKTLDAPVWYLTGGDAELLASYIEWPCKVVPELVLDGLSLAGREPGKI